MMEVINLFDVPVVNTTQHNCKQNLKVIEETHSVNSLHNIVIARVQQCRICGKKFESYDPNGLDKLY